jgi:hypothetical protein
MREIIRKHLHEVATSRSADQERQQSAAAAKRIVLPGVKKIVHANSCCSMKRSIDSLSLAEFHAEPIFVTLRKSNGFFLRKEARRASIEKDLNI